MQFIARMTIEAIFQWILDLLSPLKSINACLTSEGSAEGLKRVSIPLVLVLASDILVLKSFGIDEGHDQLYCFIFFVLLCLKVAAVPCLIWLFCRLFRAHVSLDTIASAYVAWILYLPFASIIEAPQLWKNFDMLLLLLKQNLSFDETVHYAIQNFDAISNAANKETVQLPYLVSSAFSNLSIVLVAFIAESIYSVCRVKKMTIYVSVCSGFFFSGILDIFVAGAQIIAAIPILRSHI